MLLEQEGERVRVYAGPVMRARLLGGAWAAPSVKANQSGESAPHIIRKVLSFSTSGLLFMSPVRSKIQTRQEAKDEHQSLFKTCTRTHRDSITFTCTCVAHCSYHISNSRPIITEGTPDMRYSLCPG